MLETLDRVRRTRNRVERYLPRSATEVPAYDGTFFDFVEEVNPTLLDFEHVPRLLELGERAVTGDISRLLVLLPPRYFKSEVFSRLLPAYYLRTHPNRNVGLASYSARLAWKLSGKAREYYEAMGGETAQDTDAKKEWATEGGGRMWADGVGGSITGSGFHLGVIDDPMKPKHVRSRAYREAFRHWFPETWYNRREPGAAMIVVMQRLGKGDPIDFLYKREVGAAGVDEAPQHWHVACFDEIKSHEPLADYDGPMGLPATCELVEDDREEGDILAPSRFDRAEVEDQQRSAAAHCQPQRQQRASEPTGDFWEEEWFGLYEDLPEETHQGGKDWDTAYTADESNSASAYVESYRGPGKASERTIYIHDVDWRWLETPELVAWMKQVGPPHYIESKASGKSVAQLLSRQDIPATEVEVDGGDKFARANSVQPVVSAGRVKVHRSVYEKLLEGDRQGLLHVTSEELREGDGDLDLNDAFVQAINRHTENRKSSAGKTATAYL